MRPTVGGVLLTVPLLGCGGDSNEPEDPFPDVGGIYAIEGTFDDFPASQVNFEGTLADVLAGTASHKAGECAGSIVGRERDPPDLPSGYTPGS